jgi:hypothetical protein
MPNQFHTFSQTLLLEEGLQGSKRLRIAPGETGTSHTELDDQFFHAENLMFLCWPHTNAKVG